MKRPSKNALKPSYEELEKENLQLKKTLTKLHKIEIGLIEKEMLLRTIIESLPFDIFAIDKNGRYSMQNSTSEKYWGNIIGKRPKEIQVDNDTQAVWEDNNSRAFAGETVEGDQTE